MIATNFSINLNLYKSILKERRKARKKKKETEKGKSKKLLSFLSKISFITI